MNIFVFDAGGARFGADIGQIVSIAKVSSGDGETSGHVRIVDLSEGLNNGTMDNGSKNDEDEEVSVILVNTEEGMAGVQVEYIGGVVNIPMDQIEPLPEFIRKQMKAESIWGIGKMGQELLILLDLNEYVSCWSNK